MIFLNCSNQSFFIFRILKQIQMHYLRNLSQPLRVLDDKSQKSTRLPYIEHKKHKVIQLNIRSKRNLTNISNETHVRRYEQKESITVLSVRFAQSAEKNNTIKEEETYINKRNIDPESNQNEAKTSPYLQYQRYVSPETRLKDMGYDPDIRLPDEIYNSKVEQRKNKYLNKLQALKRDIGNYSDEKRQDRMNRGRIKIKILGEQIRRNRERQLLNKEEKKGQRLLNSMIHSFDTKVS